jgi:hypothetical protein
VRKYQIKYLAKLNAIENKFAKIYRKEIKRFNKEAFEMAIYSASVPNYLVKKHQEIIQAILKDHDTLTINRFAGLTYEQFIKKEIKADINLSALEIAKRFILANSLAQSDFIAETSKDKVQKAIAKGYELGEPIDDIAKRIRDVDAVAFSRSFTIARTETHRASTYASNEVINNASKSFNLTYYKQWVPTIDARTRQDHLVMSGSEPIPMDDKFYVGGEYLDRPNDIDASPENSINCRCYLEYVLQNNS